MSCLIANQKQESMRPFVCQLNCGSNPLMVTSTSMQELCAKIVSWWPSKPHTKRTNSVVLNQFCSCQSCEGSISLDFSPVVRVVVDQFHLSAVVVDQNSFFSKIKWLWRTRTHKENSSPHRSKEGSDMCCWILNFVAKALWWMPITTWQQSLSSWRFVGDTTVCTPASNDSNSIQIYKFDSLLDKSGMM